MNTQVSARDNTGTILVSLMIALVTAMVLVIGVVGIVASANSDGSSMNGGAMTTVKVTLSEFKIVLDPPTVPAGHVVFDIHNAGSAEHNLAVKALDLRSANIAVGASAQLDLGNVSEPVEMICEIAGHEASGMKATLGIGDAGTTDTTMQPMSNDEMDAAMANVAQQFPAKTSGAGNQELAPTVTSDGWKEFTITASVIDWEVEVGRTVKGWAYNGQIPGPMIHVNVGDKVRIVLRNELPESTSLHLHGIRVPNAYDGVDPYTQEPIKPGESFTYEFTALEPSVGMYHSHHNAQVQVPNGLAGALVIGDWKSLAAKAMSGKTPDANGKIEQEQVMVLNDAGTIGLSLNGKSFPATAPYSLKVGESMVVHYYNEGLMTHPMHMHQPSGLIVARDGKILDSPYFADTINVAPGERWTVVYTAEDKGVWAWHCHILNHAETPSGMKYMVTALIVD